MAVILSQPQCVNWTNFSALFAYLYSPYVSTNRKLFHFVVQQAGCNRNINIIFTVLYTRNLNRFMYLSVCEVFPQYNEIPSILLIKGRMVHLNNLHTISIPCQQILRCIHQVTSQAKRCMNIVVTRCTATVLYKLDILRWCPLDNLFKRF